MADTSGLITGLDAIGTIDRTADLLEIVDVSANTSFKVTVNNLVGISGGSIVSTSDTQTLSNKTLGNTNVITVLDGNFTMQDNGDNTKQAQFQLSGNTTGTTRIYSLPDATGTLVDLASTQTLSGKTLTSPTINAPAISNATISANTITGFTTSNTGNIYGIAVTTGTISGSVLATLSVPTTALANTAVTPSKLATGATPAFVTTSESTTSVTYVDLTTVTDTVTVTIGVNGLALVAIFSYMLNTASPANSYVGFAISGATTLAANDNEAIFYQTFTANAETQIGGTFLVTGLTPGSTTFKMKYRVTSGTGTFKFRRIAVVPL